MKVRRLLIILTPLLFLSLGLSILSATAQTPALRARVTRPVDIHELVTLRGNVHPLARPEFDQGAAPDDLPMERMLLVLQRAPEQETALRQLLDDQQAKSAPQFHKWLTPEQFGQQFGPADSDVQAVTDWLALQGFNVTKVSAGRTVIEFSGTAGSVRQALGTAIHRFRVHDEDRWANASDPQIPAALVPVVAGFASLNNFPRKAGKHPPLPLSRLNGAGEARALFTVSGNSATYYAVGPADFGTIYNVLPLWNSGIDGTGQTIAIAGETNINLADVRGFRDVFGLPANDPRIILNGPDPGINGDEFEADIDVEWSGAVAKGATIDLVVSQTTEATWGIDLSALYIIDNNLAPIMSISYGDCEQDLGAGGNAFYYATREQGAAQGITIIASAGDSGSARCDQSNTQVAAQNGLAVSGLASTPFTVTVGGTDFGDVNNWSQYWNSTNSSPSRASAKSYIPESTWNASCTINGGANSCLAAATDTPKGIDLVAGSGGMSTCGLWNGTGPSAACAGGYPKPAWQSGNGVPQDGVRDIPDVSLFASGGTNRSYYAVCDADAIPGYLSCYPPAGTWYFSGAGGTSVAAPNFAGIMALVNQKTGQRQGNANYVLYPLAAQPGASCTSNTAAVSNTNCIFYDVVSGNNSVACVGGSKNCSAQSSSGYGILVDPRDNTTLAWTTGPGYDLATGLGSVNAANLVNKWTSVSFQPTTTTLSSLSSSITHGQPVSFIVNVTSGSGTPTGDISLIARTSGTQSTSIGSFPLGTGGSFSGATDMLPGGTYNVVAHYAGDGVHGASDSAPQPVTVSTESSKTKAGITFCDDTTGACTYGVTSMLYGSSVGFFLLRMDVTNANGQPCASSTTGLIEYPCPTGTVTTTVNGNPPTDSGNPVGPPLGTYTLNSQGYAEDQYIHLPGGTYNVVASYAGDKSYTASVSPSVSLTVTKAATALTGCTLPTTVMVGVEFGCTATVSTQSHGVAPTGTVGFLMGGNAVAAGGDVSGTNGTATTYASFQETLYPVFYQGGTFSVIQQYSGDEYYQSSTTSTPVTLNISDFNVAFNPGTITIPASGQSGTSVITINPVAGFSGTVNLSCGTYGFSVGCSVSPSSVTLSGISSATATLTATTAASGSPAPTLQHTTPPGVSLPILPWAWFGFFGLATLAAWVSKRPVGRWITATGLLLVGAWVACGGGGGGDGGGTSAPVATLSPSTLSFGNQVLGSVSPPQLETVTNTGNATLSLTGVYLLPANQTSFNAYNGCDSTPNLSPGASCSIRMTFAPTLVGLQSASISINDNAGGSPHTANVTGTGVLQPTTPGAYSIQVQAVSGQDSKYPNVSVVVQ